MNTPRRSVTAFCISLALAAGSGLASRAATAEVIPINGHLAQTLVYVLTNQYRVAKGVPVLYKDPALMQAAQVYAEYQARTNTSGHYADGRSPGDRIAAAGYRACAWAENVYEYWSQPGLASVPGVVGAAMAFWKQSPGHEANLRRVGVTHTGLGAAAFDHNGRKYYKIVQVFASNCR